MLVPWPPDDTVDILARVIEPKIDEGLGQPMVIENQPGAGGMIATEHAVTPILPGASLNFDPFKDTEPVALIGKSANVLSVPAGSTVGQDFTRRPAQPLVCVWRHGEPLGPPYPTVLQNRTFNL